MLQNIKSNFQFDIYLRESQMQQKWVLLDKLTLTYVHSLKKFSIGNKSRYFFPVVLPLGNLKR